MKKELLLMAVLSCASTSMFAAAEPDLTELRSAFTQSQVNYTTGRQMLKALQTLTLPKAKGEASVILLTEANRVMHQLGSEVRYSMDPASENIKSGVLDAVRRFFYLMALAEKLKEVEFVKLYLKLTTPRS